MSEQSHMRRRILLAALAALIGLVACGAGLGLALAPGAARFVVPGASDVHVEQVAIGTRVVSFRTPDTRSDWATVLDRQLRSQGWIPPDFSGARAQFTVYSYVNYAWFGSIWEQADVQGDAQQARIVVRRWLRLRWPFAKYFPF